MPLCRPAFTLFDPFFDGAHAGGHIEPGAVRVDRCLDIPMPQNLRQQEEVPRVLLKPPERKAVSCLMGIHANIAAPECSLLDNVPDA